MFLYSKWCDLPLSTRMLIANEFGIIKRGSTEVVSNVIKSDGYLIKEIEQALNIDALQRYLNNTEVKDMERLFNAMVARTEGRAWEDELNGSRLYFASIPLTITGGATIPNNLIVPGALMSTAKGVVGSIGTAITAPKPKGRAKGSKNKPK